MVMPCPGIPRNSLRFSSRISSRVFSGLATFRTMRLKLFSMPSRSIMLRVAVPRPWVAMLMGIPSRWQSSVMASSASGWMIEMM